MDNDTKALLMEVMDGNPGAYTTIQELMLLPCWYQLLHHCRIRGLMGSELWRVVKDDYHYDCQQFVADQLAEMQPERAEALRALGRLTSAHSHYAAPLCHDTCLDQARQVLTRQS